MSIDQPAFIDRASAGPGLSGAGGFPPAPPASTGTADPTPRPLIVESFRRLGELADVRAQEIAVCVKIGRLLPQTIQQAWPDISGTIDLFHQQRNQPDADFNAARQELVSEFRLKFRQDPPEVSPGPSVDGATSWTRRAKQLAAELREHKESWRSSKAAEQRRQITEQVSVLLRSFEAVREETAVRHARKVADVFSSAHQQMVDRGIPAAIEALASLPGTLGDRLATIPGIAPVWTAVPNLSEGFITGVAPVMAVVGCLSPTSLLITTAHDAKVRFPTRPAGPGQAPYPPTSGRGEFRLELPPSAPQIPLLIDLDADGGLIVDDPGIVQGVVLDLLATLPPGRVKVDAVDPVGLGESLNFLYPLGEAGPKVFGDRVRTTAQDAAELLVELENHIAFVNQKYLGGQYDTLSEYNLAAGEVAEPYRLVLLYNYPQAFTRDGRSWDEESLRRLQTLAGVGRRAGVFLFVVTDQTDAADKLPGLPQLISGPVDAGRIAALGLPLNGQATSNVTDVRFEWSFKLLPPPDAQTTAHLLTHVERGLNTSQDVRVSPSMVARLASQAMARDAERGTRKAQTIADPDAPHTWWTSDSAHGVTARFGRSGARGVAALPLSSQFNSALIGGRTGSGKSYLLHSLILSLTLQYRPHELDLYLIDFKEGVEFKQYARYHLPHARVVAVESKREFGVSVLESLHSEISRRGELFRDTGGDQMDLAGYRLATSTILPRIVLIIDEFHVLFERDDKVGQRAAELIDRVVRQGRAFGVHTLLASQSVAGGAQHIKTALNQIPVRMVLASSETDSRMLLADDNTDAQLLSKPGEGIFNGRGGLKEANTRFQTTFWPAEQRAQVISAMAGKAAEVGWTRRPVVFEGNTTIEVTDTTPGSFELCDRRGRLALPIGAPMSLDPIVTADLRRSAGSNILVVAERARGMLTVFAGTLLAAGVRVDLLEMDGENGFRDDDLDLLQQTGAGIHHRRKLMPLLTEIKDEVVERVELSDFKAVGRVLLLSGLHRARELDPDSYDDESETGRLRHILRDGPEVGIHTIAWVDRKNSLQRRLTREAVREFTVRIVGPLNPDDSRDLIDSDAAAGIPSSQVVVDDLDRSTTVIARRFAEPPAYWLRDLVAAGRAQRAGAS